MARQDARDVITQYNEAKSLRSTYEEDWRMCSAYCLPRHYSSWQTTGPVQYMNNTQAVRRYAFDNTGVRSLPKYAAILQRLATPSNQRYHKLTTDPYLMKSINVREYFDRLNNELFKRRYQPRARFTQAQSEVYMQLGAYGTGPKSITWRKPSIIDPSGGFAYKAWPLRDIFLLVDDEGHVVGIFRRFYVNARQFKMKFGEEGAPAMIAAELQKATPSEQRFFEMVHCMYVRTDYDKNAIDHRRHPITASYISVEDQSYVGEESGFASMPMTSARTFTEPGETYGYSPAMQAMPALGGVSAMKKTVLKQGQKAVDPPILANDDGVLSGRVDMRPGHVNYGGVDGQGRKLITTLDNVGRFEVAENLLADERKDIEDSFFVTVFQMLTEGTEMTATEVVERVAQQAALVEPTMGRLQSEDLGPTIEREIALLAENGILTEKYGLAMPPELVEAEGDYTVQYSSPMAKAQRSEDVAGFMRWLEMNLKYAEATGDPSNLDAINMDDANPEIADILSVPTRWVNGMAKIEELRAKRQDAQQQQQVMDQAPAIASVINTATKTQGTSNAKGVSNGY